MKILSNKKYNELSDRIDTLEQIQINLQQKIMRQAHNIKVLESQKEAISNKVFKDYRKVVLELPNGHTEIYLNGEKLKNVREFVLAREGIDSISELEVKF